MNPISSAVAGMISRVRMLLDEADVDMEHYAFIDRVILLGLVAALLFGLPAYYFVSPVAGYAAAELGFILVFALAYGWLIMKANKRMAMMEEMLPNFLSMMASNIRSGVTYDRALLLSSRKEFGPLAREIERSAKQTVAGKPLTDALMDMTRRTRSETFAKTMRLIVEGTKAGGDLAEMLEITAIDLRKSYSLRKEIAATILVYRLFIFVAATIGAPLLYSLTGFLINIFTQIRAGTGSVAVSGASQYLPLHTGGEIVSAELFFWYSIIAIGMTVFLSTLASGVMSKGKESEGLPELGWSAAIAFGVFFGVKAVFEILQHTLIP